MARSELKTRPTAASVAAFLRALPDEGRRDDCRALVALMRSATGAPPRMWGPSIVGFGSYHYVYPSGREGDWMLTGFSPRKQDLTLYVMSGFDGHEKLLRALGPHRTGRSCLYLGRLADVDREVLARLVSRSVAALRRAHAPVARPKGGARRRTRAERRQPGRG